MANDATIIAGSLDSKELEKSINELINMVDSKLNGDGGMASKFQDGINKMQASLNSLSSTFRGMKGDVKDFASSFDSMAKARQQAINGSKTGGPDRITFDSDVEKGLTYVVNANKDIDAQLEAIIIKEQQMLATKNEEARATEATVAAQQNLTNVASGTARIFENVHEQQIRANQAIRDSSSNVSTTFRGYDNLRSAVASVLGVEREHVQVIGSENQQYTILASRLKMLQAVYNNLNASDRTSERGQELVKSMQQIERAMQKIRAQAARPVSLADAMSISEKTLDDMAYKMRMLSAYRGGLDVTKQKSEIDQINKAYNELKRKMDDIMQKNQSMMSSNNALARSWNYMKNRLAFYLTIGASTAFLKNLIEVRSQYEMNEKALGVLVNSAERGTQIFNELSQMSLVSPYTLIELSAAAKQLVAYDVAAKDVVDTTRRLADMASAVGVPIERLTYALGQIKAYGYLNARDARMFANAGIPLVKQLSDYYTELEGKLVSTADVYDRIKKKAIDYNDVMQVVNKMTDEGGKFFNFQERMADTLKVQLANLTLAWNNMLNEIGKESQGVLSFGIGALKQLFLQWESINRMIYEVVAAVGVYKASQLIIANTIGTTARSITAQILAEKRHNAIMLQKQAIVRKLTTEELRLIATQNQVTASDYQNILSSKNLTKQKALLLAAYNKNNKQLIDALVNMKLLTAQEATNITKGKALGMVFRSLGLSIASAGKAFGAFMVSNWWMFALAGITELLLSMRSAAKHIEQINKDAAEHAKETYDNLKEYLESNPVNELEIKARAGEVNLDEGVKAWETQREKIEEASIASNIFISELEKEEDINKRLAKSFDYLKAVERVAGVMQTMPEDAIQVSTSTWGGLFGEGLKDDLKDFMDTRDEVIRIYGDISDAEKALREEQESAAVGVGNVLYDLQEFGREVQKTIKSVYEIASGEGFNLEEQQEFLARVISETAQAEQLGIKETRIYRMKAEKEYYEYAKEQLEEQLKYQSGRERKRTQELIKIYEDELDSNKALQQSFFEWLSETQSSKVREMLRNKTKEEIKQGQWLTSQNEAWVTQMAERFSKEYGTSFNVLHNLVLDANTWSVNIPVFFNTMGQLLSDIEKDYEARTGKKFKDNPIIKDAKSQVEIIDILKKKQKEVANEMETARIAGGKYWEDNKQRYKEENDALVADIHAYNALTDAEEKANKKSGKGGSKKDPLLDALKQEISLVEKLQSDYDKLSKSGASQADALDTIRGAYGKTIRLLNAQLQSYGLPQIDISQLITGKDPNKALAHFKQTLDTLVNKGMLTLERSKELEAVVEKFTLSAKTYNLDMITKGLNNELGKLKDEYELAVELDANPELGNMFADWLQIPIESLPHTAKEYASRLTDNVNKYLEAKKSGIKIDDLLGLTNDDLRWFQKRVDSGELNQDWVDVIVKNAKVARDALKKENTDLGKEWNSLLQKYSEYEYKRTQIIEQAEKERETARKKNGGSDILNAIDIRERRELAALDFEQFKQTPTWVAATGDLANLTNGAINTLIDRLEQYKKSAKNLDPKQIKDINRALKQLYSQQRKGNPFTAIADAISEAKERFDDYQQQIDVATERIDVLNGKLIEQGEITESERKELERLTEQVKEWGEEQQATGKVSATAIVDGVQEMITSINQVTSAVGEMFAAFGDTQVSENIQKITQVLDKAGSMAAAGAQIGGGWGAAVGGVLGGLMGAVTAWADEISGNAYITKAIERSERAVRRLELAYIDLEHAMNAAFGTGIAGTQALEIENKKLQLAELNRQLQLEESRNKKKYDEDRIIDLKSQIKELEYEIRDSMDNVMNELLGISSVGDAIENMVGVMIDALRNGDDAISAFNDSVDDMIANLIKKWAATNILAPRVAAVLESIQADIDNRVQKATEEAANLQRRRDSRQRLYDLAMEWGRPDEAKIWAKELEQLDKELEIAHQKLSDAGTYTIEDLQNHTAQLEELKLYGSTFNDELSALLDSFGLTGSSANKGLSALQAGIQGITEDQAGALEAITTGMYQQVTLQSDILQQINTTLQAFDVDIQTATLSQILLQLQNSYQIHQSILTTIQAWSNPAGNAVKVEIL